MPCHHTLEGYLAEYVERAPLSEAGRIPLFQAIKHRPYGRGQAELTGERLDRINAWKMVHRRAKAAGITTEVCNHTFRGTGITAYLENGGTLEKARQMAAYASTRRVVLISLARTQSNWLPGDVRYSWKSKGFPQAGCDPSC